MEQIEREDKRHKVNPESRINQFDIGLIKPMLVQGTSEVEISLRLGVTAETVSRKISAWSKTKDFEDWIAEVWLHLYGQVVKDHPVEAFRQVNRLFSALIQKRPDAAEELKRIEVSWLGPKDSVNSVTEEGNCVASVAAETGKSNRKSQEFGTGVVAEGTSTSEGEQ